jgi:hypothetical protein
MRIFHERLTRSRLTAWLGYTEIIVLYYFQLAGVTSPSLLTHHSSIPHFSKYSAVSSKRSRYLGESGSAITDLACGSRDRVSIAAKAARPYQPVACPLGWARFFSPRLRGSAKPRPGKPLTSIASVSFPRAETAGR